MPGLVPGIHVVPRMPADVDGRDEPGHDDVEIGRPEVTIVECDPSERMRISPLIIPVRLPLAPTLPP